MASRSGAFSALYHVSPQRCGLNSSFSIRRILDLPEESSEECGSSLSNSSPTESCPPALPLVPRRVVRSMGHKYGNNVPHTGLKNWHDSGLMPCAHHCSYSTLSFKDQEFPLGKWISSTFIEPVSQSCFLCPYHSSVQNAATSRHNYSVFPFLFVFSVGVRMNWLLLVLCSDWFVNF